MPERRGFDITPEMIRAVRDMLIEADWFDYANSEAEDIAEEILCRARSAAIMPDLF